MKREGTAYRPIIVGIGEVLWDVFPDVAHFGGAPANFACHAAALGADAWVVSAVGQDELGDRALDQLRSADVRIEAIERAPDPTGIVDVILDAQKQASYVFAERVAWDHIGWDSKLSALSNRCDAVCYGTLAQRHPQSRHSIQQFLEATRDDALRLFDVNLRQHFYDHQTVCASLSKATLVKLNSDELPVIVRMLELAPSSEADALRGLCARYELRGGALTRGSRGSLLLWDGELHEEPPVQIAVADTVGAGDAFTAALVMGLLRGAPLPEVHHHASAIARHVCTQFGATPSLPPALLAFS